MWILNNFCSANSDVYMGVVSWAAGGKLDVIIMLIHLVLTFCPAGFDMSYVISQTPMMANGRLVDQPLVTQCIVNKFRVMAGYA
jgi:hypothetical protein